MPHIRVRAFLKVKELFKRLAIAVRDRNISILSLRIVLNVVPTIRTALMAHHTQTSDRKGSLQKSVSD
jgi:hypothetical protein